ncbi:unnamed protein product, partial [Fusarium graminearum]
SEKSQGVGWMGTSVVMHNGKNSFGGPGAIRLAIRIGQRTSTLTWESCEVHRLTVCGQCRAPLLSCAP